MDVFDNAALFAFAAILLQRFHLERERPQKPIGKVCKQIYTDGRLSFGCRARHVFYR
jgi:hypothetical protein